MICNSHELDAELAVEKDVLDFGKHVRKTFIEVHFCDLVCCSWALRQQTMVE